MESYITVRIFCSQYVPRDNHPNLSIIRSPKTLDVQPGNIPFSLPNIDSLPESHFQTDITQPQTISDPVKRVDGKVDLWSPRYTVIPQPLTSLATVEAGFTIQISDMGAGQYFRTKYRCSPILACLATANTTTPITPTALRAPELILTKSWDMSIDIWSFGCLVCSVCLPSGIC
jgi:serine/threonine protein kinase